MVVLGGLIVVAAAWVAVSGLMARIQLERARADVPALREQVAAGDLPKARAIADDLAVHARWARRLTGGPAWALATRLPSGGEPIRTIRGVTVALDSLGRQVLPELVAASNSLDPAGLRGADGSIDLARLTSVAPRLDRASASIARATAMVAALPAHTWLGAVDTARAEVLAQLTSIGNTTRSADLAARIVAPMLGGSGPKTYFVAFQNNAEARGTGGLPGAFAIVSADHGKMKFTRFDNDTTLGGVAATVDFGPDYDQLYHDAGTTTLYVNGNLSPHFPYAAQIWASMWKKYSGRNVDGVIAVDPAALSYLLAVTGPATLPDGSQVNAANVVALTQSTAYARFPVDRVARQKYLLQIARAAVDRIIDQKGDTAALLKAAGRAASERRLLVWSADPTLESDLAQTEVSGMIPETSDPYVGLSIVNDGGNKLDYYLDRSLTWQRTGCGPSGQVTVTIALTNNAPASGLPATTVTARSDAHGYPVKPGDNRLLVGYLATAGSQMTSVTVDGKAAAAGVGAERGHPVYTVDLELPRGTTRTVVLHLTEPAESGPPIVLQQPLIRPLTVKLDDAGC
jgi:uncharacterized protein DUF4012